MATKLLIATPSYDGNVRREYMRSVFTLCRTLEGMGVQTEMMIEPATMLHTMRSVMASVVLNDPGYSHLLFIDADMEFPPSAVTRMLGAGEPVIGCAYPYRTVPYYAAPGTAETVKEAIEINVPFAVRFPPDVRNVSIDKGFADVASVGTGLMLIARGALETLAGSGRIARYRVGFPYAQYYKHSHYHGFFDHLIEDDMALGEDYSFCRRWQQAGGSIRALVDVEIVHHGHVAIPGRYITKLKAGKI